MTKVLPLILKILNIIAMCSLIHSHAAASDRVTKKLAAEPELGHQSKMAEVISAS